MRIRILGGGWYGCSIALGLIKDGHDVELHEIASRLFAGASGGNPARLHMGFHYPRSRLTRAMCQEHHNEFMGAYGDLTRHIPVNIYAIADKDSQIDFGTYLQVLRGEVELVVIERPSEWGLCNVEGAVLTGERHIVVDQARKFFEDKLDRVVRFRMQPGEVDDPAWDLTLDCTFCAFDSEDVDRYEPCITMLLEGPVDRSVTIMDGPFPSLYVWNESKRYSSLTSASLTPFSKCCRTYAEARAVLDALTAEDLVTRGERMLDQMAFYWPEVRERYLIADQMLTIRAMPRSGADARLVDVVRVGERALRVRAGKIDAIFHAERIVKEMISA